MKKVFIKTPRLIIAIAIIASLIASLMSGCGTAKVAESESQTTGAASSSTTAASQDTGLVNKTGLPIVKEPTTFKLMVKKHDSDKSTWADKECIKIIEPETNLKLDITEIQNMAWFEQVGVVIASGDLPDVFIGGIKDLPTLTDSFTPLNDLIDEYAPALVEFYQKYPELKFAGTLPDGNIYSLPLVQLNGFTANAAYSINKTWLDKLGLKIPETVDELYQVLKAFKEGDPNGNNIKDEIPYSFYANNYYGIGQQVWNFGLINDGDKYVMVENGKVIFIPTDERYLEFLKFMHRLSVEGLIDPDGFVQKNADFVAKGTKGLIGFFNHHSYDDAVVGAENADQYVAILPMKDKNGNRVVDGMKVAGDFLYDEFVITRACKYPEAMVRLYDYANTGFERKMLFTWGPENVVWRWVDGGKFEKITTDFPEGISSFPELRHTFSLGMVGFYLWSEDDQAKLALTSERDIKLVERRKLYEPYFKKERTPLGHDTPEATQNRNIMYTEIQTYIENFIAESVLKGIDDAKWKAHLENCERLNVKKYVEDYQAFYDRSKNTK